MNTNLIPIACGTALALMAGAGAAHWSSVRNMAALVSVSPAAAPAFKEIPLPDDSLARESMHFLAEARRSEQKPVRTTAPAAATGSALSNTDSRVEKLLTLLESTVQQNQELRDRIGETNRDLLELRFQVDSHDGQFRPLKVEEEPQVYDDGSAGVLPPLDAP